MVSSEVWSRSCIRHVDLTNAGKYIPWRQSNCSRRTA